jgi:hypothetical protein
LFIFNTLVGLRNTPEFNFNYRDWIVSQSNQNKVSDQISILLGKLIKMNIDSLCKEHEELESDQKFAIVNNYVIQVLNSLILPSL